MVEYFRKMFEYDDWANRRVLTILDGLPEREEKLMKITSHVFLAQRIWLSRIMPGKVALPSVSILSLEECHQALEELKNLWGDYLPTQTEASLAGKITYKTLKGVPFETVLIDILTQLVTHGPYHRGQIASLIKKAGGTPPETDYIVFTRQ